MPDDRTVLIVTEEFDPHADALILALREQGHSPFRLHTADFPATASLSVQVEDGGFGARVEAGERRLDLADVRSVWWRRPRPFELSDERPRLERRFIRSELHGAWRGMVAALDCYWMSHPEAIARANYKIDQLCRAQALGLEIPDTLVTSRLEEVLAFFDRHDGQIIYKAVANSMLPSDSRDARPIIYDADQPPPEREPARGVYATPLTTELLADLDSLGDAPGVFQERVAKDIELRVTVIGDEVFTAEIHSQTNDRTREDWRHYDVEIPWRAGTLPPDVSRQCVELTRGYDLAFGAIDLIRTPDGRHVFLEINPNGQWLFVEERIPELRMREALAACLLRGANS